MKKYLICVVLIACASICLSGEDRPYKTIEVKVTAHEGDRLDVISEQYYEKCTRQIKWREYRDRQRDLNADLFKNGRCLQPGDKVKIEYYVMQQ